MPLCHLLFWIINSFGILLLLSIRIILYLIDHLGCGSRVRCCIAEAYREAVRNILHDPLARWVVLEWEGRDIHRTCNDTVAKVLLHKGAHIQWDIRHSIRPSRKGSQGGLDPLHFHASAQTMVSMSKPCGKWSIQSSRGLKIAPLRYEQYL